MKTYVLKLENFEDNAKEQYKEIAVSSNLKKLKKIALKKSLKMKRFANESWFKNKKLNWEKEKKSASALLGDDYGSIIMSISEIPLKDEFYTLTKVNTDDGAIVLGISNSIKTLKKVAKKELDEDISLKWEKYIVYKELLTAKIDEDGYFLISKPKLV